MFCTFCAMTTAFKNGSRGSGVLWNSNSEFVIMSETCIVTAYYSAYSFHHNNLIDIFSGYPLWDDNPNMWMQALVVDIRGFSQDVYVWQLSEWFNQINKDFVNLLAIP